jgi:hypothetical protein
MRKLNYTDALVIYDGLQVFVAKDQFGTKYICTLVEQSVSIDKYICAPISFERLQKLFQQEVDLRDIYVIPEADELFIILSEGGILDHLSASPISLKDIPEAWLPQSGFYIKTEQISDVKVIEEAISRNRAIIHLRLNPPEALSESKIYAENLSQATKLIQRLIKHSYRKAIRHIEKGLRETLNTLENYQLEIFAFSPGSFTVHMQSSLPTDLIGYAEIERAFDIIDYITVLSNNPDATVEKVSQLGGHFASAYKDLLKFMTDTGTNIDYEWASPQKNISTRRSISASQAKPLYEALIERSDIEIETISITGRLTKVDEKLKTWRLKSESDGKEYSGSSEVNMAGLVIDTEIYELICEERLEEEKGSGKEFTRLYIISLIKK